MPNSLFLIENCSFIENTAEDSGGAIYLETIRGNITIIRNNFTKNVDLAQGTAIFLTSLMQNAFFLVGNCLFSENIAMNYGAAISMQTILSIITIQSSNFSKNTALSGGAIFVLTLNNTIFLIENCLFIENIGVISGGVIYLENFEGNNITVAGTNFSKNFVNSRGGAIYLSSTMPNSTFLIENCLFMKNIAQNFYGGAMYWQNIGGTLSIIQSNFINNSCSNKGGAISLLMFTLNSAILVDGCMFSGNQANTGGAIYFENLKNNLLLTKNIFSMNSAFFLGGVIYSTIISKLFLILLN